MKSVRDIPALRQGTVIRKERSENIEKYEKCCGCELLGNLIVGRNNDFVYSKSGTRTSIRAPMKTKTVNLPYLKCALNRGSL
jgi:hypothetical protein